MLMRYPCKVAGVRRIVMCTPTRKEINPYLLVADIAGVDEIYRHGVQAIGAMAFGTKTIAKVDKIVSPSNMYVATAKRCCTAPWASIWWPDQAGCWL